MADSDFWGLMGGSLLTAGIGAIGANQAAKAQQGAANQAADASRRGTLAELAMNEPQRYLGYQAQGDLSSLYGYTQAPYSSGQQLAQSLTPLDSKQIAKMLKRGATYEQISASGTLQNLGPKAIKRLTKQGLTIEQIQNLTAGRVASPLAAAGAAAEGTATGQPAAGNMSRFFTSPDYQYRQEQTSQAVDRMAAARGGALSGNAITAAQTQAGNLASGEYGNYVNRLMQMAGLGSAATNASQGAVSQGTQGQMQAGMAAGDARASGVMGVTNSITNAINSGIGLYGLQQYLKQPQGAPTTTGPITPTQPGPWAGGYQFPQTPPPWSRP
jgi:hypothetical protein